MMRKLTPSFKLRTDGGSLTEDLEELRNSHAGQGYLAWLEQRNTLELLGELDHGDPNYYIKAFGFH